jgi:hypothetical protein
MGVRLTWRDLNYGETEHRVYRSTSTIDPQNLPAPLATLGAGVELYDDYTAVNGTTYYYRVGALVNGTEYVSQETVITPTSIWLPQYEMFNSGELGFVYDVSEVSTLWQDSAGTVPVTTNGHKVARIDDLSGNGFHLTETVSSYFPTYRTDGTYHWLEFDGSSDRLNTAMNINGWGGISVGMAFRRVNTNFFSFNFGYLRNSGLHIGGSSSGAAFIGGRPSAGSYFSNVEGAATTSDVVGTFTYNLAVLEAFHNGVSTGTTNVTDGDLTQVRSSESLLNLPSTGDETTHIGGGRFYAGVAIDRVPASTTERQNLETWLANRCGVTL